MKKIIGTCMLSLGCALAAGQVLAEPSLAIKNSLGSSLTLVQYLPLSETPVDPAFPREVPKNTTLYVDINQAEDPGSEGLAIYKYNGATAQGYCIIHIQQYPVGWILPKSYCSGNAILVEHGYDMMNNTPHTLEIGLLK